MGIIATLGSAYIDVHANTSPFARELRTKLAAMGDDFEVDIETNLDSGSTAATEAGIRRVTRDREVDVTINRRRLGQSLAATGRVLGTFALSFVRILGDFFNFGRQIGQIFGEAFGNVSKALGGTATSAVTLGQALAQVAASGAALVAVLVLMSGILGIVLALIAPLVQAIQLIAVILPGLGLAAVAAFGPLVLAFSNLGSALEELKAPAEDFNKEIEEFGTNTQGALRGARSLVQFFLRIRDAVQESFFEPVNQAIQELNTNLGPTFRNGFEQVAAAAGRFAAGFISLFNHPQAAQFFENIFGLAELGFDEIGDAVLNLVEAFANLIDEVLPQTEDAIQGIADTIDGWAESINEFADSEDLQETLDTWQESFNAIAELLDTIVDSAFTLVEAFQEDGVAVLEDMNSLLEDMNEFFESDAGEEFFDGLRISANLFLVATAAAFVIWSQIFVTIGAIDDIISGDLSGGIAGLNAGPLASMNGLVVTILGVVQRTGTGWGGIRDIIVGATIPLSNLRNISINWRGILGGVSGGWSGILNTIQRINPQLGSIRGISVNWRGILGGVAGTAGNIRGIFNTILRAVRGLPSPLNSVRGALGAIAGAASNFRNIISSILGTVRGIAGAIGGIRFPSPPSWLNLIPGFQEGGIITRPTRALVGEAGPEVIIPLTRPDRARELFEASGLSNIIGADGASAMSPNGMQGSGGGHIVLEINSGGSRFDDALIEVLRRAIRVRGGDSQVVLSR